LFWCNKPRQRMCIQRGLIGPSERHEPGARGGNQRNAHTYSHGRPTRFHCHEYADCVCYLHTTHPHRSHSTPALTTISPRPHLCHLTPPRHRRSPATPTATTGGPSFPTSPDRSARLMPRPQPLFAQFLPLPQRPVHRSGRPPHVPASRRLAPLTPVEPTTHKLILPPNSLKTSIK
jgi:hypothetical protein